MKSHDSLQKRVDSIAISWQLKNSRSNLKISLLPRTM